MNIRNISAIAFFLLLAALLALTYWPDIPDVKMRIRGEGIRLDYIGHLGFYAAIIFTFLLWQAGWQKKVPLKLLLLTLFAGLALGVATEFTQQFIHGRSFNPLDLAFNCAGVLIGLGLRAWGVGRRA